MGLFDLFKSNDEKEMDPYWIFDENIHYQPHLNKSDFLTKDGFDFGWFILEPLSVFVGNQSDEIEKNKALSYGQKALYFWWYLDAQVTNGGFVQFFYNGYGQYMPTIIKGLEYVGDDKMAGIAKKAFQIYLKKIRLFNKARNEDLFGSDLYDKLDAMCQLDDKYYELHHSTMRIIEEYARKHPNEFCLDENGKELVLNADETMTTYYPSGKPKEVMPMVNGQLSGEFVAYYENGNVKEKTIFKDGVKTRIENHFYENGKPKSSVEPNDDGTLLEFVTYYENGQAQKLTTKKAEDGKQFGDYKEWYENGQLFRSGYYIGEYERDGDWLEFYDDGAKRLVAEFINKEYLIKDFWNKEREHVLIDGTGIHQTETIRMGKVTSSRTNRYRNQKRHGLQESYRDGILSLSQEYEDGVLHGSTKTFYKNGNLKEETIYKKGDRVSGQKYPMFKNPKVKVTITHRFEHVSGDNGPKTVDQPTAITNAEEVADMLFFTRDVFEGYPDDYDITYTYRVMTDETGFVESFRFAVGANGRCIEDIEENIPRLEFEMATYNGKPVPCQYTVWYRLNLVES